MSNDLVIDEAYLASLASDLESVAGALETLCSGLRSMEGPVVGAPPLFDKLSSFAEAWSRCSEDLAEYADNGALQVRTVLDAFADVDAALNDAMRDPGRSGVEAEIR